MRLTVPGNAASCVNSTSLCQSILIKRAEQSFTQVRKKSSASLRSVPSKTSCSPAFFSSLVSRVIFVSIVVRWNSFAQSLLSCWTKRNHFTPTRDARKQKLKHSIRKSIEIFRNNKTNIARWEIPNSGNSALSGVFANRDKTTNKSISQLLSQTFSTHQLTYSTAKVFTVIVIYIFKKGSWKLFIKYEAERRVVLCCWLLWMKNIKLVRGLKKKVEIENFPPEFVFKTKTRFLIRSQRKFIQPQCNNSQLKSETVGNAWWNFHCRHSETVPAP